MVELIGCATEQAYPRAQAAYQAADFQQAEREALRGAQAGDTNSQYLLGLVYFEGRLGAPDYPAAFGWLSKAADSGHVEAQHLLGIMYSRGAHVEANQETAVYWYRKSAEGGSASGQFDLGWRYNIGRGVDRDLEQARYWYESAAAQGHEPAEHNLRALSLNLGGRSDNLDYFEPLRARAAAGDPEAQWELAHVFLDGRLVGRDRERALFWLRAAAENGHPKAVRFIEIIEADD